jgi:ABC-type phosphate transport system permease subunit
VTEKDGSPSENIFKIMDEIVHQLNKTKKLFIIMIIAIVVAIPLSFHITFLLLESPAYFGITRIIPVLLAIAFIVIGVRQWFVLSKWTRKYEQYKELQKKVDEKLGLDNNDQGKEPSGKS